MIRLFAADVDGTMTDGSFFMDGSGNEYKRFDVKDGYGIVMLKRAGVEVALISGRRSAATDARARDLGISRVVNGAGEKLPLLEAMASELGLTSGEVAYIGDDLPDIECIKWAGLGMAVADSIGAVLDAADWVSSRPGGRGAVREAAERVLCLNAAS